MSDEPKNVEEYLKEMDEALMSEPGLKERHEFQEAFLRYAKYLYWNNHTPWNVVNEQIATRLDGDQLALVMIGVGPREKMVKEYDFATTAKQRDELRDLCVLLLDAVKHGNQVTDLPGLWNKAEEVLARTAKETTK